MFKAENFTYIIGGTWEKNLQWLGRTYVTYIINFFLLFQR